MRGNLSEFAEKVNQTAKNALSNYAPEIEVTLGLGKVKVAVRAVPVEKVHSLKDYQDQNER